MASGVANAPAFDPQFLERHHSRCVNACGPDGTGKTAFVETLADFFDESRHSSEELAETDEIGLHEMGRHLVIEPPPFS